MCCWRLCCSRLCCWRLCRPMCLGMACVWLLLAGSVLEAAQPIFGTKPGTLVIRDVELDADGSLRGVVLDAQGIAIRGIGVVAWRSGREIVRTLSDGQGRFLLQSLGSGACQVMAGSHVGHFRAWAAGTAPPKTRQSALMVIGPGQVRGQMPIEEFFSSNAAIITGIIAGAIAVPVAYHNVRRDNKAPQSP